MFRHRMFRYRWVLLGLIIAVAFASGWAAATADFATRANSGLVQAFNSVGQNLLGRAVFNAIPPNPIGPVDPIRLFIADDTRLPVAVSIFHPPNPIAPPNPCRVTAQLLVGPEGVRLELDPEAFPEGEEIQVDYQANLSQLRPDLARCPATLPGSGDF